MLNLDNLLEYTHKRCVYKNEDLYASAEYYTKYFGHILSGKFIKELSGIKENMSYTDKANGSIKLFLHTKDYDSIIDNSPYIISEIIRYGNVLEIYEKYVDTNNAHVFYGRIDDLILFKNINHIKPIIEKVDFRYSRRIDSSLCSRNIKEIARSLAISNKVISYVGPNYLGNSAVNDIERSTNSSTFFDSYTKHYNKDINWHQLLKLAPKFMNNIGPFFRDIEAAIYNNRSPRVLIPSMALSETKTKLDDDELIDLNNQADLGIYISMVKKFGEDVVSRFINYDQKSLIYYISSLQSKPDYCKNWKVNGTCPSFYKQYYGQEIGWETKCSLGPECKYCSPDEYAKAIRAWHRSQEIFSDY